MNLHGKVALVTGGAVRIGRAICEALAAEGARVVIHYRSSRPEAVALAKDIGGIAIPSALDSESACRRLVAQCVRKAGRLDLLVNNVATFHKDGLRGITARKLNDEFWPNLFVPALLIREFARVARRGAVVNLLDRRIAGLDTSCIPYVLTKKAAGELTRLAALELAPQQGPVPPRPA